MPHDIPIHTSLRHRAASGVTAQEIAQRKRIAAADAWQAQGIAMFDLADERLRGEDRLLLEAMATRLYGKRVAGEARR